MLWLDDQASIPGRGNDEIFSSLTLYPDWLFGQPIFLFNGYWGAWS